MDTTEEIVEVTPEIVEEAPKVITEEATDGIVVETPVLTSVPCPQCQGTGAINV